MSHDPPDFKSVFSMLKQEGIQFVVIGGLAGIFHGNVRVTLDIDICHARTRENLEALARVLKSLRAELRVREGSIPFRPDWKTLEMGLNFTLKTTAGDLDLMGEVTGVGGYNECLVESISGEVAGTVVQILSLPKLIQAKRAAGRPKDLDDLRALEKLQKLDSKDTGSEAPTNDNSN